MKNKKLVRIGMMAISLMMLVFTNLGFGCSGSDTDNSGSARGTGSNGNMGEIGASDGFGDTGETITAGNGGSVENGSPGSIGNAGNTGGTHNTDTYGNPGNNGDGRNTDETFRVDEDARVTKNGSRIPIRCGAWFGLEGQFEPKDAEYNPGGAPMELFVGNMWWSPTGRTIQQTMKEITAEGINVIRLPIAPQTLDPSDLQGKGDAREGGALKNHESVRSINARRALEDFIVLADKNDIEVIIDIHSCSNYVGWRAGRLDATPPYVDADRDNYEYTREEYSCGPAGAGVTVHEYNKSLWLENLKEIAGLSSKLGVDNILAIDIFNEPWDYTWPQWKALAESAFEAINSVNASVLIMVEGIGAETSDGTAVPHGNEDSNPNWGENLFPAGNDPLNIPKDRLIFSPHTYGPSVYVQKQFIDPAQPACTGLEGDRAGDAGCNIVIDPIKLEAGWEEHFGFLKGLGYAVVIGEFGGRFEWPRGAAQRDQDRWNYITNQVDEEWQNAFVDYMMKKDIEGCYWSINPESGDAGGLYLHAYDPESNPSGWGTWLGLDQAKLNLLKRLWYD